MSAPLRAKLRARARGADWRAQPGRAHNALDEIDLGARAHDSEPVIIARDDLDAEVVQARAGAAYVGRVYLWWMAHSDDGACARTDPHDDLAYVGKTRQPLWARIAQHLARSTRAADGSARANNSAVYRNRARIVGVSVDPRVYTSAGELSAAEDRAIKTLWPAWNVQQQDRRNPHTRATRAARKPDRLSPVIGIASIVWAVVLTALGAFAAWLLGALHAGGVAYLVMIAVVAFTTGGAKRGYELARGKARARRERNRS